MCIAVLQADLTCRSVMNQIHLSVRHRQASDLQQTETSITPTIRAAASKSILITQGGGTILLLGGLSPCGDLGPRMGAQDREAHRKSKRRRDLFETPDLISPSDLRKQRVQPQGSPA